MKKAIILFLFLGICSFAHAQERKFKISDTLTNEFLDTVTVKKKLKLNDYSLIGVQYGATLSQVMWNPTQKQQMLLPRISYRNLLHCMKLLYPFLNVQYTVPASHV